MLQWYYLVFISSILMGLATIIQKEALIKEHASAYSASISFVAAIVSLFLLPFANFSGLTPFLWAMIIINALMNAATYLLNSRIFKHESLSIASPLFSSMPSVFTVLFAFVALDERLSWVQYLSIAVMVVATYALLFQRGSKGVMQTLGKRKYAVFIILTIIITAAIAVQTKYILDSGVNYISLLIIMQVLIAIFLIIHMHLRYGGLKETVRNLVQHRGAIVATAVLVSMYRLFYFLGVILAPIALVTPLRNTAYVIITVLSGGVMFKEKDLKKRLALTVVLLIALYVLILNP